MQQSTDTHVGPKQVFLHLLLIGTLYFIAIEVGVLLFGFIEIGFPDVVADRHVYGDARLAGIRFAMAMLIVLLPVHIWTRRSIHRSIATLPAIRELRSRRWLLHLTLFLAAIIVIGDAIAVIRGFLDGELTARFLMKVLAVLAIAGTVLLHERWEIQRDQNASIPGRMRALGVTAIGACAAIVVAGFFVAGSPKSAREVQFDAQRIQSLQQIQNEVVRYWQKTNVLPVSIDDLRDEINGFLPPADPRTEEPFGYRATGELTFELCATFTTDQNDVKSAMRVAPTYADGTLETWLHGAELTCFRRTISPERHALTPQILEVK
jgi:hypothetical protein